MSELLVTLRESGTEIREMLIQVYRDNAMKERAVYKWVTRLFYGREIRTDAQRADLKKTLQNFVKVCVKIVG
jgi:hypothetical protein